VWWIDWQERGKSDNQIKGIFGEKPEVAFSQKSATY
jgi:hypothetical protein